MARTKKTSTNPENLVQQRVVMMRLVGEIERAVRMSEDVQAAIHGLQLNLADRHARIALQSADHLTQSLQCMTAALIALAEPAEPPAELDIARIVKNVFLADVRQRLIEGTNATLTSPRYRGQVDLFRVESNN